MERSHKPADRNQRTPAVAVHAAGTGEKSPAAAEQTRQGGDHRQAAALNHLLGQIGLSNDERTQWWNLVAHNELGGKTATQAWLAGDADAVVELVERWYAASADAAGRAARDPEFVALLRRKLADLHERTSEGGSLHRSA